MTGLFLLRYAPLVMLTLALARPATAALVAPTAGDSRFGFNRGDANTTYQEWNTFTDAEGAPGNNPDVGSSNAGGTANLQQNVAGAFLTGGGNIYSFAVATDFDVALPNLNFGSGFNTLIAVQLTTLGTELDYGSLTINGVSASYTEELDRIALGGFGGAQVDYLAIFNLAGNASNYTVSFTASGSSMSLDRLVIDTYAEADVTAPSVPEPSSLALLGIATVCGGGAYWRRKKPAAGAAAA